MPRRPKNKARWTADNKKCLSALQAHVCRRWGVDPEVWCRLPPFENFDQLSRWEALSDDATDPALASRYLDEYSKKIAKYKVPTKFESPHWHWLTNHYCERIESAAVEMNLGLAERPLFGTLPLGTVNALALRSCGDTITLFYVGLFNFLNAISKLMSLTFPSISDQKNAVRFDVNQKTIEDQILNKPGIKNRFIELFEAYIIHGDSVYAPRYLLGRKRSQLQLIFLRSSELFVIAHEYGHILLDHLNDGRERKIILAEQEVRGTRYAWKQEYEADIKGIELTITTMRSYGIYIPVSLFGIGMFFSAISIFERIRDGLRTGIFSIQEPKQQDSHPPPYARLIHLKEAMERSLPDGEGQQCGFLLDLPYIILTMMFKLTEDHWVDLYKDGVRPASIHQF